MVVAICTLKLQLYGVASLKAKRRLIKSILSRISQKFHVSIAETNYHDIWQTAEIGVAVIGTDAKRLHAKLEKIVRWVETNRLDLTLEEYHISFR